MKIETVFSVIIDISVVYRYDVNIAVITESYPYDLLLCNKGLNHAVICYFSVVSSHCILLYCNKHSKPSACLMIIILQLLQKVNQAESG